MGALPDKGRKLRVVTLIDQLGITGGAERVATEVVTRLDPDRFERTLCVSRWSPDEEADPLIAPRVLALREAGVRIVGHQAALEARGLGLGAAPLPAAAPNGSTFSTAISSGPTSGHRSWAGWPVRRS